MDIPVTSQHNITLLINNPLTLEDAVRLHSMQKLLVVDGEIVKPPDSTQFFFDSPRGQHYSFNLLLYPAINPDLLDTMRSAIVENVFANTRVSPQFDILDVLKATVLQYLGFWCVDYTGDRCRSIDYSIVGEHHYCGTSTKKCTLTAYSYSERFSIPAQGVYLKERWHDKLLYVYLPFSVIYFFVMANYYYYESDGGGAPTCEPHSCWFYYAENTYNLESSATIYPVQTSDTTGKLAIGVAKMYRDVRGSSSGSGICVCL